MFRSSLSPVACKRGRGSCLIYSICVCLSYSGGQYVLTTWVTCRGRSVLHIASTWVPCCLSFSFSVFLYFVCLRHLSCVSIVASVFDWPFFIAASVFFNFYLAIFVHGLCKPECHLYNIILFMFLFIVYMFIPAWRGTFAVFISIL